VNLDHQLVRPRYEYLGAGSTFKQYSSMLLVRLHIVQDQDSIAFSRQVFAQLRNFKTINSGRFF
jgi:hypothetical protein